jgi:hypothetical protein
MMQYYDILAGPTLYYGYQYINEPNNYRFQFLISFAIFYILLRHREINTSWEDRDKNAQVDESDRLGGFCFLVLIGNEFYIKYIK